MVQFYAILELPISGSETALYAASYLSGNDSVRPSSLEVLYEDNHLLAIAKPAGLATVGVAENEPSAAKRAKEYLKSKYQKPGNVYLGVVSRLDATVTGVLLFARTSKAAARLSEQLRSREAEKTYLAILEGTLEPPSAEVEDWVAKNDLRQRMEVVGPGSPNAQIARLRYRRLAVNRYASLVEVQLETGRKHQIRLQFAARHHPIWGDKKYGSARNFTAGIALHSAQLVVRHPTQDRLVTITCPPPASWRSFGFDLTPWPEGCS